MLTGVRRIISRSGPCADSLGVLEFYLAALEKPLPRLLLLLLRLKFSPNILAKIRASGLPAAERARLFSGAMNLFRGGATYKTTCANRSPLTDRAILKELRPGLLVVETGVSDGSSALGLLEAASGAELVLTDRQAAFHYRDTGPFRLFYDAEDGLLSIKLPGFYLCTGMPAGPVPPGAGAISLLNPVVEEKFGTSAITVFDIFTGTLPRKADIIKCANVLSRIAFTRGQMRAAVENLARNLAEGGLLFICQNNARYKDGEAVMVLRKTGAELALQTEINGHEMLPDILSPEFAGLVRKQAAKQ
jgi:hypothetical protein